VQHVLLPKKFSPFKWSYFAFCNPTVLSMLFCHPFFIFLSGVVAYVADFSVIASSLCSIPVARTFVQKH
jgi:hypothetical protein